MNSTNLEHSVIALVALAVLYGLTGNLVLATYLPVACFITREHTQAEYHWIKMFGQGKRENMPWWGGFDYRAWTLDGFLDAVLPLATNSMVYILLII